jgi:hypothetical protein
MQIDQLSKKFENFGTLLFILLKFLNPSISLTLFNFQLFFNVFFIVGHFILPSVDQKIKFGWSHFILHAPIDCPFAQRLRCSYSLPYLLPQQPPRPRPPFCYFIGCKPSVSMVLCRKRNGRHCSSLELQRSYRMAARLLSGRKYPGPRCHQEEGV